MPNSTQSTKILFLDQSGNIGGAELSLLDVARPYRDRCLVGLFQDGPYRQLLERAQIPVQILTSESLEIRRDSPIWQSLLASRSLISLVKTVIHFSREYDIVYTNTPKAFIVGAIASAISRHPLVYHLRDILSREHFSWANVQLLTTLANRFARLVIANSQATRQAFIDAGGRPDLVQVVYNGFNVDFYQAAPRSISLGSADLISVSPLMKDGDSPHLSVPPLNQSEAIAKPFPEKTSKSFVVGHFSRFSAWKGQHILLEALAHCPNEVSAWFVGDALFGEQAYVEYLYREIDRLNLHHRVKFFGFQDQIPQLMAACHLITHTSTAPEPFGRVIVEAMLCGVPVVAVASGGAVELVEHGKTGWLMPSSEPVKLAEIIHHCRMHPEQTRAIAQAAQLRARTLFSQSKMEQKIDTLLQTLLSRHV